MSPFRRAKAVVPREPAFEEPSSGRRHMRWLPFAPLLMAVAGFAMHVAGGPQWSDLILVAAFLFSLVLFWSGPLRNPSRDQPLDEREMQLRLRSQLAGTTSITALTILGAIAFSYSDWLGTWAPTNKQDWQIILYVMLVTYFAVPVLHASWTTRPIKEEE